MTAIEKTKELASKTQIVTVQDFITKKKDLIARVLPKAITPERLLGIFEMILNSSPKLKECSQKSLIGAVIQTAQLGLQPGNIGHIHLVPFNNKGILECQLIIGYKGYVELVNRSREATILSAEVVYEKDQFQYEQGLNPILRHIPTGGDRGEKVGVYCIAKNLLANEKVFVYLQREDVEKIKAASKSASSEYSPWTTWPDEMWKKSAVKRISKLLPLSAESEKAISADETIKTEIAPDMTEVSDTTDWQNQEPIDVPTIAQNKPQVAQGTPNIVKTEVDTASEPEDPENSVKPMPAPLTIQEALQEDVGKTIMLQGILSDWEVKSVIKKDKKTKAELTNYLILSEDSQYSMTITKWGGFHDELKLGDTVVFEDVKISLFNNEKKYLASAVSLLKAKEEIE